MPLFSIYTVRFLFPLVIIPVKSTHPGRLGRCCGDRKFLPKVWFPHPRRAAGGAGSRRSHLRSLFLAGGLVGPTGPDPSRPSRFLWSLSDDQHQRHTYHPAELASLRPAPGEGSLLGQVSLQHNPKDTCGLPDSVIGLTWSPGGWRVLGTGYLDRVSVHHGDECRLAEPPQGAQLCGAPLGKDLHASQDSMTAEGFAYWEGALPPRWCLYPSGEGKGGQTRP